MSHLDLFSEKSQGDLHGPSCDDTHQSSGMVVAATERSY